MGANLLLKNGNGNDLGGHQIDALCYCLGEFRELAAFVVSQRDSIFAEDTGGMIAKTSPDQLVVNGIVGDGAVVSFQIRGGMARGTEFLFEIHGDAGDLALTATTRASMQRARNCVCRARAVVTRQWSTCPSRTPIDTCRTARPKDRRTMSRSSTRSWP